MKKTAAPLSSLICLSVPVVVLLASALPARADGDGPTRKMTPSESAAYRALRDAVRGALPKAAANYTLALEGGFAPGEPELAEALKPGQMARLAFAATYTLAQRVGDAQQQSALMDRVRGTPEQQAKIAAFEAKNEELRRARDASRDRAEKDRIRAEMKAVQAEEEKLQEQIMADYQAWVASGGAMDAMRTADAGLPAKKLSVRVVVNADTSISEQAAPYPLKGFPLAFGQTQGCQEFDMTCLTVFIGPFEKERKAGSHWLYRLKNADPGVATKARGLVVVVSGPKTKPEAARSFLGQVDLARLKTLVP